MNDLETRLRALRGEADDVPADLADRALRQAHRRRTTRRALAVAGTAVAGVLVVVAGVNVATSRLATPAPAATPGRLLPRENVLIIGSDEAPNRVGVRPDTIVLASIDTRTGDTELFGLPRTLGHVPFPPGSAAAAAYPKGFFCPDPATGVNDCLLNAVWSWAETGPGRKAYPGADPGLAATRDVVGQITGLPVTGSVVVTMPGLQRLVDAVGGVRIDVRERLPVGGDAVNRKATGWIEPGVQTLDGYHALWYVRSRWNTSDFDRMRRQQCLLRALAEQTDARTLARRWPALAPIIRADVRASFDTSDPSDLALWTDVAGAVRRGKVHTFAFTNQVIPNLDDPDYARIRSLIAHAITAGTGSAESQKPAC